MGNTARNHREADGFPRKRLVFLKQGGLPGFAQIRYAKRGSIGQRRSGWDILYGILDGIKTHDVIGFRCNADGSIQFVGFFPGFGTLAQNTLWEKKLLADIGQHFHQVGIFALDDLVQLFGNGIHWITSVFTNQFFLNVHTS